MRPLGDVASGGVRGHLGDGDFPKAVIEGTYAVPDIARGPLRGAAPEAPPAQAADEACVVGADSQRREPVGKDLLEGIQLAATNYLIDMGKHTMKFGNEGASGVDLGDARANSTPPCAAWV